MERQARAEQFDRLWEPYVVPLARLSGWDAKIATARFREQARRLFMRGGVEWPTMAAVLHRCLAEPTSDQGFSTG